nr:ribonuclease H-like domain-containing protein [Tanacetum cinerariifolium]
MIKVLPSKTAEEVVARERERKARTTLLMALLEDHLAKFHKMADAKEMWEAIKSRFGGNDESKKMHKDLLKQQFKGFSVSTTEGLHKGYDRFQTLLSQLEIHGAGVSHEDANQKFLSFDDLYNNLSVFERDVKGTTASSSNTQNVAFMSAENTSSTNDINDADMEEIDLKWQGILLETIELKGTKTAEEEMLGTMEIKLETMVKDLHIRMIQKLWLPLMERILTGLDMLRKMLRTML